MWPTRREMNRDECRKYLRYLELDAYGSMISVLRAQGPFTSEKQKLLQELAKVLHISNERHRAEVRRAVNDEKLTTIAEQLGGPNTGIDWTIEGRRTIPLLPRLKARSAFTTLANSLSLATAAASEKKPFIHEKPELSKDVCESQTKIKVEENSPSLNEVIADEDESSNERISSDQISDLMSETYVDKQNANHDIVQLCVASRKRKSPSPLPTTPPNKVLVISSSPLGNSNHCATEGSMENSVQSTHSLHSPQEHNPTINASKPVTSSSTIPDSQDTGQANVSNHATDQPNNCTSTSTVATVCSTNTLKPKIKAAVVQNKRSTKVVSTHVSSEGASSTLTSNLQSCTQSTRTQEEQKISSTSENLQKKINLDHVNSTSNCTKRVVQPLTQSITRPVTTKIITSHNSQTVTAVCPGTIVSSGPGPPQTKQPGALICKNESVSLNHQTTAKTNVTLNSQKTVSISQHSNTKLAPKTNVIVIQKGHTKGVTLSHAGKEVLGKVIMGGKNLCVTTQHSGNSVSVLPHHITINNGDQTGNVLSTMNSSHKETIKPNIKPGNTIVFNLRQDVLEKKKVLSQLQDSSSALTSEPKTVIYNTNARSLKEQTNSDLHINDKETTAKADTVITSIKDEKQHRKSKDSCMSANLSESTDSANSLDSTEICVDSSQLTEQDEVVSKIEEKEMICNSEVDVYETPLTPTDISLENVQYLVEDNENYIIGEAKSPILSISQRNILDNS